MLLDKLGHCCGEFISSIVKRQATRAWRDMKITKAPFIWGKVVPGKRVTLLAETTLLSVYMRKKIDPFARARADHFSFDHQKTGKIFFQTFNMAHPRKLVLAVSVLSSLLVVLQLASETAGLPNGLNCLERECIPKRTDCK